VGKIKQDNFRRQQNASGFHCIKSGRPTSLERPPLMQQKAIKLVEQLSLSRLITVKV
jgi:hypothetical protein